MANKCFASKLLRVANEEVGYHEKATNTQLDDKNANPGSGNYTKYAEFFDKKYPNFYNARKNGFAWCDMFVDWCFVNAFGYDDALRLLCQPEKSAGAGTKYSYKYFKDNGKIGKEPKIGSQIFFSRNGSELGINHTGIVEYVDAAKVYCIEGNTSNSVARRTYSRNSSIIIAYGYPEFDTPDTDLDTYLNEMEWTPKSGKIVPMADKLSDIPFGNMSKLSKTIKGFGKCIAESLNVRTLPGASNPTLKSIPFIKRNTEVEICDKVKADDSSTWLYVRINGTTYGFVSSKYIQFSKSSPSGDDSGKYSIV